MSSSAPSFFVAGGTLGLHAPSYVERAADHDLFEGLGRGEFCHVLTSRQMGKSSLMVRTTHRLRDQGRRVAVIDLTRIGQNLTVEQWYDGMLSRLGEQLGLEDELEQYWRAPSRLGPAQRFFGALGTVVLPAVGAGEKAGPGESPSVVIFVDEIDVVRSLKFSTDEFFAGVRECYNRRAEEPAFQRLTFCLLGVAAPSDLISDPRVTPFNVGRRIELHDFTAAEATPLARGLALGAPSAAAAMLDRVLHWTNGHPFLTQRFCAVIAGRAEIADAAGVDELCRELFLSSRAREQDDNLLFVRERLARSGADLAGLMTLYERVRRGRQPVRDDATHPLVPILHLAGIVRSDDGVLRVRNRIYEHVFDSAWVGKMMPDAEKRRQRAAFLRGVARTAGIAAVLLAGLTWLAIYARQQARQAEKARGELAVTSVRALQAQARSGRLSGAAGQRFDGLAALQQAAEIDPGAPLRDEALACLALPDLRRSPATHALSAPEGATAWAVSADHAQCAWGDGHGRIHVRRLGATTEAASFNAGGGRVTRLWFSPDNHALATETSQEDKHVVRLWELGPKKFWTLGTNHSALAALAFSTDGGWVALALEGANLLLFDLRLKTGRIVELAGGGAQLSPGNIRALAFQPGLPVLAVSRAGVLAVELRQPESGQLLKSIDLPDTARGLAWSDDGTLLAAALPDQTIRVRNLSFESPPRALALEGQQAPVAHLAFSRGGHLLASAGEDGSVCLWDAGRGGRPSVTWAGDETLGAISQFQFGPGNAQLLRASADGAAHWFDVAEGKECRGLFDPGILSINGIAFGADGTWLACAHEEGVTVWDVPGSRRAGMLRVGAVDWLAINPRTGALVTSDLNGVNVCPATTGDGRRLGPAENLELPITVEQVAVSQDGRWLAVADGARVHVRHGESFAPIREWDGAPGMTAVALASDGRWVAAGHSSSAGDVRVWEIASGTNLASWPMSAAVRLETSPTGQWLAVATASECRLWNTKTWAAGPHYPRAKTGSTPGALAFSPDGRTLAWARHATTVELIDLATGGVRGRLEAPRRDPVRWICFSPDGAKLACAAEKQSVTIWDLAALRQGLAKAGLDWKAPALPGPPSAPARSPLPPLELVLGAYTNRTEKARLRAESELVEVNARLEHDPRNPLSWRQRARLHMDLKRDSMAIRDWQECLQHNPSPSERAWALRDLAQIYLFGPLSLRNAALARARATEATRIEPWNKDNFFRLGAACYRLGDYPQALTNLARAEELSPTNRLAQNLFYQAMAHARLHQSEHAQACLLRGIQLTEAEPESQRQGARWENLLAEAREVVGH